MLHASLDPDSHNALHDAQRRVVVFLRDAGHAVLDDRNVIAAQDRVRSSEHDADVRHIACQPERPHAKLFQRLVEIRVVKTRIGRLSDDQIVL